VTELLKNYRIPQELLKFYLQAYYEATKKFTSENNLLVQWLEKVARMPR